MRAAQTSLSQLTHFTFSENIAMASPHDFVSALARTSKTSKEIKAIMDESYGPQGLSISQVRRIMAKVRNGEDPKDSRGGSQKTARTPSNIKAVETLVDKDRRITVVELVEVTGLSNGTVERILKFDLGLSKRCTRWVPRLLSDDHRTERKRCADLFLKAIRKESRAYLDMVVTTDETWVSFSTPETKEQSKQWVKKGSKPPVKALKCPSEKKVMVVPFFDSTGLIYTHYVPKGATINAEYFVGILKTFLKVLKARRPHKWNTGWALHMDNARPHTARLTMDFIKAKNITLVPHPPYSPDLAPADFWLFPNVKKELAGSTFESFTEVKAG